MERTIENMRKIYPQSSDDDLQRYIDLRDEGYGAYQAKIMAGLIDPPMDDSMIDRAKTLLDNTKKLRFFKGQVYDGGADIYLSQLHSFLADYIAANERKRPVAFRYKDFADGWVYTEDEGEIQQAIRNGHDTQGLYVRDGIQ